MQPCLPSCFSSVRHRPLFAGIAIGAFAFKPHLAVLFPFALAAARYWGVFVSAAVTTIVFVSSALLVIGWDSADAFFANLPFDIYLAAQGILPWSKSPSVFISLRMAGVSSDVAYLIQMLTALLSIIIVSWVWWRYGATRLSAALLICCTVMISPHFNDHDLAILAVSIALFALHAMEKGWAPGERELLVLIWLVPMLDAPLASVSMVHIGLIANVCLIVMILRRLRTQHRIASIPTSGKAAMFETAPEDRQ